MSPSPLAPANKHFRHNCSRADSIQAKGKGLKPGPWDPQCQAWIGSRAVSTTRPPVAALRILPLPSGLL